MVPEKGLLHLLVAMSRVVKEVPEAELHLVGDGPLMSKLKEVATSLEIASHCVFFGRQTDLGVKTLLSKSSVFVLPSLSEGLPRALLEAMACGNAIVASDLPQIRETTRSGECAILCNPGDSLQLARGLSSCLTDTGLAKRLGDASRRLVEEHFDIDKIALEYQELYKSLIDSASEKR